MSGIRQVPFSRSVVPSFFRQPSLGMWDDPWEDFPSHSRLFDQHFGVVPSLSSTSSGVFCPSRWVGWYQRPTQTGVVQETGVSEVTNNNKEFKVRLDVNHFKPEEITVKTVENRIIVHGSHEERQDEHGYIKREFTRQYVLPKETDAIAITSSLSPDGVLSITAPKKAIEGAAERVIPVVNEAAPM